MSDSTEEAVEAIKGMGITHDEDQIREALWRCNNNPQEAVQLLLPESPNESNPLSTYTVVSSSSQSSYNREDSYDADVDMRDTETHPGSGGESDHDSTTVSYSLDEDNLRDVEEEGPENLDYKGGGSPVSGDVELQEYPPQSEPPPPRYEDIVGDNQDISPSTSPPPPPLQDIDDKQPTPTPPDQMTNVSSSIEFPLTHFYELEGRVHTDQWSIPYKRDESLAVCMVAAIKMIREGPGIAEGDENCKKFLERTMGDAFSKLITHEAVYRWDATIMEGILDMCRILLELIAERLKQKPIPVYLLNLLSTVFNADCSYHSKMRNKRTDHSRWQRVLGEGNVFAVMPHFQTHKDPKGWLVECMNIFAQHGGIQAIKSIILNTEGITLQELTALFQPFSVCEDYISPNYLKTELSKCILRAMRFVHDLSDDDMKDKEVGCVSELLKAIKTLLIRCSLWDLVTTVDNLRLSITIRMLNIPHFNAKMNALKEVVRLTEEPYQSATKGVKSPISSEKITDWLVNNKVLSIALGGNLHQSQYCHKLQSIVEFLGTKLSLDELSTIWEMQVDKNPVQVENVHGILAAAASRFTASHLDHLFQLIQQSWESASDRYREKLLQLIGKIGKDDRQGKTASKILELLWGLAHLPQLSREMVDLALEAHSSILIDSYHTKEAEKRTYISKCVEDIRKGTWVVAAFRQLHRCAKGFFRSGYGHKDQHQIAELQRQFDLLRLTCNSLCKCHLRAVQECKQNGETLNGDTIVEGRYTHSECVDVHLKFMAFLLQDGALYMPNKRACEVWDTLIANPTSCNADRTLAFKWFDYGMGDLEHETQLLLFNTRVLKVEPSKLDIAGYHCLRNFFETINLVERKLRKISASYHSLHDFLAASTQVTWEGLETIVENPDLTGIDYLWKAALEVQDTKIADELINNILQISYQGLSTKLKKDVSVLHNRFIDECFRRLDDLMDSSGGAVRISTGKGPNALLRVQMIERLLLLAHRYIMVAEENHHFPRYLPPHGACFLGHPIALSISSDQPKTDFKLDCHSNESILSVRQKIAKKLNVASEQVQMGISERWLDSCDNNKLIHQLGFADQQLIIVKTHSVASNYSKVTGSKEGEAQRQALAQEQERTLPGVIMANKKEVFDKLEQLCEMGDPGIIMGVRCLLMLLPTHHQVTEALEVFTYQPPEGASEDPHSPPSPQAVLEELFGTNNMSPTQLLYNLEVLSSQLMPTQREVDDANMQVFRRNFLEAGGLKFVINVLQRNALPSTVDLTIRQDCYAIALSLARFLLCNQALLAPAPRLPLRHHSAASQASSVGVSEDLEEPLTVGTGGTEPMASEGMGDRHKLTKVTSTEDEVARLTIETMSVDDFATTLAYLMRVCWSAAAGQLHLASIGDLEPSSPAQSLRGKLAPSSTLPNQLQSGICAQQERGSVSAKDAAIAREALELLVTCLKLRSSLLNIFYTLPHIEDFVMDILLGSPHVDIRLSVVDQLDQLCQTISTESTRPPVSETTPAKRPKTSMVETPHHFFLHLLIKHQEPLWKTGAVRDEGEVWSEDSASQWDRCTEYFNFRCRLLQNLRVFEQEALSVDVHSMMRDELQWLNSITLPHFPCLEFQNLLAGHLRLCQSLFTCEGVDKKQYGHDLVSRLLSEYLFPASKMILESQEPRPSGIVSINPMCNDVNARGAAYDLLVGLASGCYDNLTAIAQQLITMHHQENSQIAKEWEFQPPVVSRALSGYVGLKNAGATCYMNSVLQQLYMTHPIREIILSAELDAEDETILPELQCVFGHLLESKLQYYSPENFWKKFKLWGQPVNVREQQDAFDFFCNLTDQVDEQLKRKGCPQVFKDTFGGAFLDQKICRDCEHTYEQEESFLSLSLPVKSKTLEESLKEFVKGDWLEGDNAYFCEKCNEKRDTLKRTCIKTLPPLLMVQLKRFGYDWEANRAIKYDDYFEFPWLLDLEQYTADGLSRQEKDIGPREQKLYELVGIVVHSGQASAGHYYSFIKVKRPPTSSVIPEDKVLDTNSGRWIRFNDILVDEFAMNDPAMEAECFGGSYKAKSSDTQSSNPEIRIRYWNAYLLFYAAVVPPKLPAIPRRVSQSETTPMSPLSPHPEDDKLSQLQALVQKGEKRHMFSDTMPPEIQRSVNEENLQFMQHRDVYCPEYFAFMCQLVQANGVFFLDQTSPLQSEYGVTSLQLAINFLFHTYFRTRKKLRSDMDLWVQNVEQLVRHCREACRWFINLLGSQGCNYLKPFLLECTSKEVRMSFCHIISSSVQSYISFGGVTEDGPVASMIDTLLQMLDKDVVDNSKSCAEYFEFFRNYASYPQGCRHLLEKDVFVSLVTFLLGPSPKTSEPQQDKQPRRWSSNQVKEFGPLHGTLSLLVRNSDISMFESETNSGEEPQLNPYMIPSNTADLRAPSDGMHQALFTIDYSKRFIHECVLTLRESDPAATEAIASTFCYCCWNNQSFSACAIEDLQIQIARVASNELKAYFKVLTEILLINDQLQTKRISFTISGGKYQPHVSIFTTIQNNSSTQSDSKKAYQGIKFLVGLANKCTECSNCGVYILKLCSNMCQLCYDSVLTGCKATRDFLLSHPTEWQWAVVWLRRKMSDYYSWPQTSSVSNESSGTRVFQRTVSAQDTLEEANALLNELEARDSRQAPQVVGSSDKNQTSENTSMEQNTSNQSNLDRIEG